MFNWFNSQSGFLNVLYALGVFAFLQVIVGLAFFSMNAPLFYSSVEVSEGVIVLMPLDRVDVLNDAFKSSYPFEGTVKFISRIYHGNLFERVVRFSQTDVGRFVSNIPNVSGVSG